MRLVDLDPRWLMKDGARIGFVFRSPTLGDDMWMTCFEAPPPLRELWPMVKDAFPEGPANEKGFTRSIQPMNQAQRWQIAGGIDAASFETMTVTPSLDGSPGGNWHGFITNGQIVGGI
ncbi:MAG TPA: hypothetical protein VKQ27_17780 [Acetobacteraceae bacterium]|nr:hypothetical protein [Acetobacteraceae bacterium]